jgi:DNA ligase-1
LAQIATGFSDADLEQFSQFFKEHLIDGPKSFYRVADSLQPDVRAPMSTFVR